MSEYEIPQGVERLKFDVLHPIRDFVIDHGVKEHPDHPLKYVRMRLDDGEEELVICVHDTKEHTRLRISMGDVVPQERLMIVVFKDEPESWMKLDLAVNIEDVLTLSMAIQAGSAIFGGLDDSEAN